MEQPIIRKRELPESNDSATQPQKPYSTRSTTVTGSTKPNKKIIPRLKALPYNEQDIQNGIRPPPRRPLLTVLNPKEQKEIQFYLTDDHPFNRRGFKYKPCAANPFFPSLMYGTTDIPPYKVRFSYFDRSQGSYLDDSLQLMCCDQGWRSCRTNVGMREGSYYVEFKIVRANEPDSFAGHVRVGLARKEASIEAPVGFDGYGYGLRDKNGHKLHLSRPLPFMSGGFTTGDVIGMLVELPSLDVQRKISEKQVEKNVKSNPFVDKVELEETMKEVGTGAVSCYDPEGIVRDQIPIRYKNQLYFEQFEYTLTTPIEHLLNPVTVFGEKAIPDKDKFKPATLPNSKVTFFKNGVCVGVAFEDLYAFLPPNSEQSQNPLISNQKKSKKSNGDDDKIALVHDDGTLGYYPMVSSFKNGCVEIVPGPEFSHLPLEVKARLDSGQVKPLSERYSEKVVEDTVWDIIDEVESQYLDTLEE